MVPCGIHAVFIFSSNAKNFKTFPLELWALWKLYDSGSDLLHIQFMSVEGCKVENFHRFLQNMYHNGGA